MRKYCLLILLFIIAGVCHAQQPVAWTFTAVKTSNKNYEVTLTATVQAPWHIYSQTTPDGGPVATKITYNNNPFISMEGKTKEEGKSVTKFEDVFGVNVIYFSGMVSFVQKIKVEKKIKTTLNGTIEYMVCNDAQCLPPVKLPFTVAIK